MVIDKNKLWENLEAARKAAEADYLEFAIWGAYRMGVVEGLQDGLQAANKEKEDAAKAASEKGGA